MLRTNIHPTKHRFSSYKITILIFIISTIFSQPGIAKEDKLAKEAQSFLASLPAGLQKSQEEAVRKAIGGDFSALLAVRNSRNAVPKLPKGVSACDIDDHYRLYRPIGCENTMLPVLIYLHGGGWCFSSINSCARFCAELSQTAGIAVLAVEYPLAPEHPYPAALNACTDAVRFAHKHAADYGFIPGRISIGGDSAGGNLALATMLNLIFAKEILANQPQPRNDTALPAIHSLVLFYPVTKTWADSSASWQNYAEGVRT